MIEQGLAVSESDGLIGGIFLIGALVPLGGIPALSRNQLCDALKRRGRGLAISQLRRQFGHPQQVSLGGLDRHQPIQHFGGFLLFAQLSQIGQRSFVGSGGQFFVGSFQKLSKAKFLLPGGAAMPDQLFVGQAGAGRVASNHLPLKEFAQQADGVAVAAQGKREVRRQLPHGIVVRIVPQDLQVLVKGLGRLTLLQEFLRPLDALGDFGPVQSLCDLRHAEWRRSEPCSDSRSGFRQQQCEREPARLRRSRLGPLASVGSP